METVLLTTSANLDGIARNADVASLTHTAVKLGNYYLTLGTVFEDLLSLDWDGSDWTAAVISQNLKAFTFRSIIPSSKGLSRDFQLRRVYLADVYVYAAITNTLNDELDEVSFENSARARSSRWSPQLSNTFILFSETESNAERNAEALRKLYSSTAPVNRSMIGDPVAAISTPFKNLMLFNSYSQGVISNVLGENNCVFLVDVKLSLGCEGSPIFSPHHFLHSEVSCRAERTFPHGGSPHMKLLYVKSDANTMQNRLLGLVMNVFTWVRGEWIGFSMAVNLHAAVSSWMCTSYPKLYKSVQHEPSYVDNDKIDSCGVVVVSSPHKWGSGVVFNKHKGIIITCSHVVNFTVQTAVTITFRGKTSAAEILCATPENTPYDLAVIRVHSTSDLKDVVEFKKPTKRIEKGETVSVIGYPLFSPKKHSVGGPSLTHGHVAKVYSATMALTTCVTNSGASGGALVRSNGELLGVVSNNVIIEKDKLLVPHITVVIPFDVFWTPMERFCHSQRVADLNDLSTSNRRVRDNWQLIFSGRFLESKL